MKWYFALALLVFAAADPDHGDASDYFGMPEQEATWSWPAKSWDWDWKVPGGRVKPKCFFEKFFTGCFYEGENGEMCMTPTILETYAGISYIRPLFPYMIERFPQQAVRGQMEALRQRLQSQNSNMTSEERSVLVEVLRYFIANGTISSAQEMEKFYKNSTIEPHSVEYEIDGVPIGRTPTTCKSKRGLAGMIMVEKEWCWVLPPYNLPTRTDNFLLACDQCNCGKNADRPYRGKPQKKYTDEEKLAYCTEKDPKDMVSNAMNKQMALNPQMWLMYNLMSQGGGKSDMGFGSSGDMGSMNMQLMVMHYMFYSMVEDMVREMVEEYMEKEDDDVKEYEGYYCGYGNATKKAYPYFCPNSATIGVATVDIANSCQCFKYEWNGCRNATIDVWEKLNMVGGEDHEKRDSTIDTEKPDEQSISNFRRLLLALLQGNGGPMPLPPRPGPDGGRGGM